MPRLIKETLGYLRLQVSLWMLATTLASAFPTCLTNEDCLVESPRIAQRAEWKTVDNTSYCCLSPQDYVDLNYVSTANITCHCKSANQKAAEYADETMGQGRSCNWGSDCATQKDLRTTGGDFCCLGAGYPHVRVTQFGNESVCRCQSSSFPLVDSGAYVLPPTNLVRSSGEMCMYNHGCGDSPSVQCRAASATFCCYASRGLQTVNDPFLNVTRCTCTNQFVGTQCAGDPYQVPNTTVVGTHACRSGSNCRDTSSQFLCSHGDTVFCCPQQGVNLTIVDDVIASCTCVSAGHTCNITFTSSGSIKRCVQLLALVSELALFSAYISISVS